MKIVEHLNSDQRVTSSRTLLMFCAFQVNRLRNERRRYIDGLLIFQRNLDMLIYNNSYQP
jgi:hypothetical protein